MPRKAQLLILVLALIVVALCSCDNSYVIKGTPTPTGILETTDTTEEALQNKKTCKDMFELYVTSQFKGEYNEHLSLFESDILKTILYAEYEKRDYTATEGDKIVSELFDKIMFGDNVKLNYEIGEIKTNDEEVINNFKSRYLDRFEDAGLSFDDIEKYVLIKFDNLSVTLDDTFRCEKFTNEIHEPGITLYKRSGTWYMEPGFMGDDLFVDLLETNKNKNNLHENIGGFPVCMEDSYAKFSGNEYYLSKDPKLDLYLEDLDDPSAHLDATHFAYSCIEMIKISTGEVCQVGVLTEYILSYACGDNQF